MTQEIYNREARLKMSKSVVAPDIGKVEFTIFEDFILWPFPFSMIQLNLSYDVRLVTSLIPVNCMISYFWTAACVFELVNLLHFQCNLASFLIHGLP